MDDRNELFISLYLKIFCDYKENQDNHLRAELIDGLYLHYKNIAKYRKMWEEESLKSEFLLQKCMVHIKEPNIKHISNI